MEPDNYFCYPIETHVMLHELKVQILITDEQQLVQLVVELEKP